jgi:hypothetical protein
MERKSSLRETFIFSVTPSPRPIFELARPGYINLPAALSMLLYFSEIEAIE